MPYRVAPAPPAKIPDGPDYIGAAQRLAKRNRRIGLALTAAFAAGGVAVLMVHRSNRANHQAAFDGARLDLEGCLLGPEPLAAPSRGADSCSLRIRRRQLLAMTTPVERRIDEGFAGWPMRCSEATRRMTREGIELEDPDLQREADRGTKKLATMKALSAPIDLPLCTDASGHARSPHLASAAAASFPSLSAPLDLDALVAHGPPTLPPQPVKERDFDKVASAGGLMPEGYVEVGTVASSGSPGETEASKLPDFESLRTDSDWPGVIHVAKCQAGKCQKRIVSRETFDLNDPELRASDAERFRAARVGESIVAVWRGGTRGALRMRVAPIDRLATTRDVVVFDDLVREGGVQGTSTLDLFRVYGGTREARIILVTSRGTWSLSVDEKGAFALR